MKNFSFLLLLFLSLGISSGLSQDSAGVGRLPFEWSGQWGIYHRYGFPGWGIDIQDGPLLIDGNFAHWGQRYAFPFASYLERDDGEGVSSALWYRKGDWFLDEFAFEVNFADVDGSYRFEAMKRNFADYRGLLGPPDNRAGTVQQNYRLLIKIPAGEIDEWRMASAYYRTSDGLPAVSTLGQLVGEAARTDRILANGLDYIKTGDRTRFQLHIAAFSQRLKVKNIVALTPWSADLISYKARTFWESLAGKDLHFSLDSRAKYIALNSDSLGNQTRLSFSLLAGLRKHSEGWKRKVFLGAGFVSPDHIALQLDGQLEHSTPSTKVFASIDRTLHSLPLQWSGRAFPFSEPQFASIAVATIRPSASAVSQVRTLGKAGFRYRAGRSELEIGYFISRAAPHYFFQRQATQTGDTVRLTKHDYSGVQGLLWEYRINYLRTWWLTGSGISLLGNKAGWGTGVQHQGTIALTFQEFLFRKHLDARVKLWTDFWIGRNRYVWDPVLSLGYRMDQDVYEHDAIGILNAEFKGIISSFEISYTMTNVLYAGQAVVEAILGHALSSGQLTLVATPYFPAPGRLAFFTIRWNFSN